MGTKWTGARGGKLKQVVCGAEQTVPVKNRVTALLGGVYLSSVKERGGA